MRLHHCVYTGNTAWYSNYSIVAVLLVMVLQLGLLTSAVLVTACRYQVVSWEETFTTDIPCKQILLEDGAMPACISHACWPLLYIGMVQQYLNTLMAVLYRSNV